VVKLAGASGHQVTAPANPLADTPSTQTGATPLSGAPARREASGGSTPWAPIGIGAVALLSLAAIAWRRRRARARPVG
jgi:MYXO-CTERM domain-containing protein